MFIHLYNICQAHIPVSQLLLSIDTLGFREEGGVEDDTRSSLVWDSCGSLSFVGN